MNNRKIIGTVGPSNEVIQYRLEHEYGAKCTYEISSTACWVKPNDQRIEEFKEFRRNKTKFLAHDKYGQLVFLATDFTI
jgi:peptide chain release factor 3